MALQHLEQQCLRLKSASRTYGEERFDMIHCRFLIGSVTSYADLFKRVYNALKPGGWVEVVEMEPGAFCDDGSLPKDAHSIRWWDLFIEACVSKVLGLKFRAEFPTVSKRSNVLYQTQTNILKCWKQPVSSTSIPK